MGLFLDKCNETESPPTGVSASTQTIVVDNNADENDDDDVVSNLGYFGHNERIFQCEEKTKLVRQDAFKKVPPFPFPFPRGGLKVPPIKPTTLPLPPRGAKVPPIKPTTLPLRFTLP